LDPLNAFMVLKSKSTIIGHKNKRNNEVETLEIFFYFIKEDNPRCYT